jgi:hypothetical protein
MAAVGQIIGPAEELDVAAQPIAAADVGRTYIFPIFPERIPDLARRMKAAAR